MERVPDVTAADIERLAVREFPEDTGEVKRQLADLDPRVQAAILKLSQGDLDRLTYFSGQAALDYRDVLAWAEYPEYMQRVTPTTGEAGRRETLDRDWAQYSSWFDAR